MCKSGSLGLQKTQKESAEQGFRVSQKRTCSPQIFSVPLILFLARWEFGFCIVLAAIVVLGIEPRT